jgi:hypothetical protein
MKFNTKYSVCVENMELLYSFPPKKLTPWVYMSNCTFGWKLGTSNMFCFLPDSNKRNIKYCAMLSIFTSNYVFSLSTFISFLIYFIKLPSTFTVFCVILQYIVNGIQTIFCINFLSKNASVSSEASKSLANLWNWSHNVVSM